ncbi:MAG: head fiber protein [Cetobacterium sp.]
MPKEERQIKEITDNDLDTARDLVTENYELEILTLKDKVDLRKFSRSFLKVDKLLKNAFTGIAGHIATKVSQIKDGHMSKEDKVKLDNIADNANNYSLPVANSNILGGVKIGNGINIDSSGTISIIPVREGLVPVGALLILTNENNPALMFPGTTWNKIEDRFLYGATSGQAGQTGGAGTVILSLNNIPSHNHPISISLAASGNHRHQVDNHSHGGVSYNAVSHFETVTSVGTDAGQRELPISGWSDWRWTGQWGSNKFGIRFHKQGFGSGGTGAAAPYTNYSGDHNHGVNASVGNTGGGQAFSILPPYYKVHFWKRIS